jgi:hypothetical protein
MELATPATRAISDPLAVWALDRIRLEGRPFSFEGHEYLRAIYDDTSPHVVLSKAAQIGGTTWALLRALHGNISGLTVAYYFPTKTDVLDFSRSRVGPLVRENSFLAKLIRDTDTVGLKQIGDGFLFFRGMQSAVQMKSIPADMVVFDELDEVEPDARILALERISHSLYGRTIDLSNPSLPGYGIDEQYERSDQRHWVIKCPGCRYEVCLEREFPAKLGQEVRVILPRKDGSYYRACPRCTHELDLAQGQWVADYPDRKIHGYRISQLFSAIVNPGDILNEYRTTKHPNRFYNLKIGVPWADLERRLDPAAVLACLGDVTPWRDEDHECHMGVDTGKQFHVVILRKDISDREPTTILYVTTCESFDELGDLMDRFQVRRCVIDAMPEIHATRQFAKEFSGRAYMCFFNENQRGKPNWNRKERTVEVNRTEALDMSRALVRERKMLLSRGGGDSCNFFERRVSAFSERPMCPIRQAGHVSRSTPVR